MAAQTAKSSEPNDTQPLKRFTIKAGDAASEYIDDIIKLM